MELKMRVDGRTLRGPALNGPRGPTLFGTAKLKTGPGNPVNRIEADGTSPSSRGFPKCGRAAGGRPP